MLTPEELEKIAWCWLLSIERLEPSAGSYRRDKQQVLVTMHPGTLHHACQGGAPLVLVSVNAGGKKRIKGSGNSLAEAAAHLWRWNPGATLPKLPEALYALS